MKREEEPKENLTEETGKLGIPTTQLLSTQQRVQGNLTLLLGN